MLDQFQFGFSLDPMLDQFLESSAGSSIVVGVYEILFLKNGLVPPTTILLTGTPSSLRV